MTTLEEPSQHPPPGSLLNDVVTARHRSLHSIKCYPSVNNGLQGGSGSIGGGSVAPSGWDINKDGHSSHGSGGHVNGSVWSRTKGGGVSDVPAIKLLQAQHQQLTYCSSSSNSSSGVVSSRLHPHHGSGSNITSSSNNSSSSSRQQDRQPYRSHSERSGRWPPNADKIHYDHQRRFEDDRDPPKNLCRSNSSLDLLDQEFPDDRSGVGGGSSVGGSGVGKLNREYGSASSIDVMSMSGESFFDLLKVYNNNNVENHDQRSPGPSNIAECLRGRVEPLPVVQNASNTLVNGVDTVDDDSVTVATSPKNKTKFHKLWEIKERKGKSRTMGMGVGEQQQASIFRKLRGGSSRSETSSTSAETSSNKGSDHSLDPEARNEEKLRKKAFAHYDVQSVSANLSYAVRLRSILGMRRNTTTGASAASMANRNSSSSNSALSTAGGGGGSTEDLGPDESDFGDGRSNELVLSCPFFRNELGGEDEKVVSLTRVATSRKSKIGGGGEDGGRGKYGNDHHRTASTNQLPMHRPNFACGLSILEGANDIHWKTRMCPYQRHALQRENVDHGALYYKNHFLGREHQNWFGMDELLGPVAVSIRREKLDEAVVDSLKDSSSSSTTLTSYYQYRLIIRTSELATLRGTVLEDAIPNLKHGSGRAVHAREVLEYVAPELQLSCLRLGTTGSQTEDQLLKLDQQGLTNHYKVGILYCRAGQSTEEEMYNNEHSSVAFDEFLDLIGQRVRLKGFDKYRAQLDNKTDSTGLYSVYSTTQDSEIMFHVSTMLPYTPNNRQQLLRKRHIGNDIVTIIFQEPDALPFTPRNIRSHFQHVFIVVRVQEPCTDNTRYSVVVSRSKDVPMFGPPIPEKAKFPKSKAFVDFLLAKVVNAENAAHRSDKFATMATRTRQEYLKDLATNHVTTTTIDTGPKFPMLSFGGRKKDRSRPRFIPDAFVRSAIVWQVQIEAEYSRIECFLGISGDTMVLVDEKNRDVVFACPCASILGWSSQTTSLRVFYHQGECIVLRTKDPEVDEIHEIVARLTCVTRGCETQELTLHRNSIGQLGFHVQHDGLITEVESQGHAFEAGLRQNSRLVEICKIVVSTLSYEQMVDLLKTSSTVVVTVVPPAADDSPRRGCSLHNCSYLSIGHGGDYENIHSTDGDDGLHRGKASPRQQVALQSSLKGSQSERTSSPTRSTPSSGYGSRRSVMVNLEPRFRNCEMTSASSQSSEEKWYDLGEMTDTEIRGRSSGNGQAPEHRRQHSNHYAHHHHHSNSTNSSHHQHYHSSSAIVSGANDGESASPPPLPARSTTLASSQSSAFNPLVSRRRGEFQQHATSSSVSSSTSPSSTASGASSHHNSGRSNHGYHGNYVHLSSITTTPTSHDGSTEGLDDVGNFPRGSYTSDQLVHDRLHRLRVSSADDRAPPPPPPPIVHAKPSTASSLSSSPSFGPMESPLDRCNGSRSEDELSGSSGNSLSPRTRKRRPLPPSGPPLPPSSSNGETGNRTPNVRTANRTHLEVGQESKMASRLGPSSYRYHINGQATSGGGGGESTFQEDLLKLINPDLIASENSNQALLPTTTTTNDGFLRPRTPPPIPSKTNSLDRISKEIHQNRVAVAATTAAVAARGSSADNETPMSNDVIFTTARPATVISTTSSSSSPAPSDHRTARDDRLSPRATVGVGALASKSMSSLPTTPAIYPVADDDDADDIDWPRLVETASKAVESVSVTTTFNSLIPWIEDVTDRFGLDPLRATTSPFLVGHGGAHRIRELESKIRVLEEELVKEKNRKAALELEVKNLRDENSRLQEESHTAAAQLRRFTEWFFQSMDKL